MAEKTCLVIGGGRGMGAATAKEMQKRGYKLSLMSPSDSCEQLAEELNGIALRGKAEVPENLKSIIDFTMEKYGRIDSVLVHVGGPPKGDLLEIEDEDWDKANQMIIKPVIRIAKLVTPIMLEQGGGSIVNITTFSAFEPSLTFPTSSVYRAGVSSFTKLFSDRYGADNIRMNCLLPGFTDSLNLPDEFAKLSSLNRLARAEEQAKAAAFLLSDDSSYITGQSIRSDGGVTRHM
ncbi:MAG: SDR family oxidoreductase [Paracoccaceae bacterium]|jgi:NAD(P)-dependent dehydrogenase (short-subunit alcohol dehydrogenase family)|nr:SDR family oxidoreductase [Paracoccaceae bacterium]MEC7253140.1 SDR family oxidoreductase [Pseudomonadota bacterium]MEC8760158.1 SDR family oxidoreductase [Pseudomonadota bacterium]NCX27368.1 SDR family oxidoreductase [Rhodobacterales bacterium]|tara:strand:+ start:504 stop:1205 length:702 start_codon:yes stop_codon:yes gene_type:complete